MQGRCRPELVPWLCVAILTLAAVLVPWRQDSQDHDPPALVAGDGTYPVVRTIRYAVTAINPHGTPRRDIVIRLAAPLAQTSVQRTLNLHASHPYTLESDPLGNRFLRFELPRLAPYGRRRFEVRATVAHGNHPNTEALAAQSTFLGESPGIEVAAPEIVRLAGVLDSELVERTASRSYRFAAEHVDYTAYLREDHGALHALRTRRGDCTEGAALFAALARANGIPARRMAGFLVSEDRARNHDYHNWAEFHHADTWWIADPQNRVFATADRRYVALRILDGGARPGSTHDLSIASASPGLVVKVE